MKAVLTIFILSFGFFLPQETVKLNGRYRLVFDQKYAQQGYQITFKDSVYIKKMPDALTYRGSIRYEKYRAMLRKDQDEDPIEIDNREFKKDTMAFTIRSKRDLSRVVSRGTLIKMK